MLQSSTRSLGVRPCPVVRGATAFYSLCVTDYATSAFVLSCVGHLLLGNCCPRGLLPKRVPDEHGAEEHRKLMPRVKRAGLEFVVRVSTLDLSQRGVQLAYIFGKNVLYDRYTPR